MTQISSLESTIRAEQASGGDYLPVYQLLVNTEFFVPVLQKDSGDTTQDFRFAVRGDIHNAPMLVISEEMSRLQAQAQLQQSKCAVPT
jgi:hypothetical protein